MFLGIDVGTSAVKAVLADEAGRIVDQASASLTVQRPGPLQSEQRPADWWSATNRAVLTLDAGGRAAVRAVGLSGQMHGATLLDEADQPLRPAILWNDGRSAAECAALEAAVSDSRAITGNLAMPGFTAPKLMWVRAHEPELFDRIACVLLPKDYVRLRMTGDKASDLSDSAGTLWLDVAARAWSPAMLDACGLTDRHMPALFEGTAATGTLRAELAEAWGMDPVPVAAGGGDNAAGAAGAGVIARGEAFLSLGTSGVLFLADDAYRPNPAQAVHTFCHCLPDRWHQMSVLLSAASCVDWIARATGAGDAAALMAEVEDTDAVPGAAMFLPYLSGERTPHNDPHAQGVFFGLTHQTGRAELAQAVLEGVAFAFADGLDALAATGAPIEAISVIGGGARSRYWGRILSAVLNRPLIYRQTAEAGPAYGAARLARLAVTGEAPGDVCTPPPVRDVVEPDDRLADRYRTRRPTFTALYQSLKPHFDETAHDP